MPRVKRSVSLPADVAAAIARAAAHGGMTFSAWRTASAVDQLRLDAGRRALAEWERDHGALTAEELAEVLARARSLLNRTRTKRRPRASAK